MASSFTGVHLTLPRWVYMPGETAEADHETLAMALALVPARFEGFVPARHPALRYGLGLNDAGFFWESTRFWKQSGRRRPKAAGRAFCCAPASRSPMPT